MEEFQIPIILFFKVYGQLLNNAVMVHCRKQITPKQQKNILNLRRIIAFFCYLPAVESVISNILQTSILTYRTVVLLWDLSKVLFYLSLKYRIKKTSV
ncbi:hypothetical protein EGR_02626 [Echinococcus granulosus]|uniref:Uncharacterized protein n=1 Tax=Echinococcus granulosus TaxID=6210 RepID=W6V7Q2_ECHGR|nr:hypothetical protein EGR_02626 [Echinococcus granulosus]EUB62494.1 hypothetical protein EGR_02626 [Echinococcus granulosus]